MTIQLLKKCVDSFCHNDFDLVWSVFKVMMIDQMDCLWKEINFEGCDS